MNTAEVEKVLREEISADVSFMAHKCEIEGIPEAAARIAASDTMERVKAECEKHRAPLRNVACAGCKLNKCCPSGLDARRWDIPAIHAALQKEEGEVNE